jgi:hypothetical protein
MGIDQIVLARIRLCADAGGGAIDVQGPGIGWNRELGIAIAA